MLNTAFYQIHNDELIGHTKMNNKIFMSLEERNAQENNYPKL